MCIHSLAAEQVYKIAKNYDGFEWLLQTRSQEHIELRCYVQCEPRPLATIQ